MSDFINVDKDEFGPIVEASAYLNASPSPIIIINERSEILYANFAMCTLSEYDLTDLLKMTISCLIPNNTDHPHHSDLSKFISSDTKTAKMSLLKSVPLKKSGGDIINVSVERMAYSYGDNLRFCGIVKSI